MSKGRITMRVSAAKAAGDQVTRDRHCGAHRVHEPLSAEADANQQGSKGGASRPLSHTSITPKSQPAVQ